MGRDSDTKKYNTILTEHFGWFVKDKLIDPRDLTRYRYICDLVWCIGSSEEASSIDVLDVGSGAGDLAISLAKMGYKVTGFDVSDKAVALANKKSKGLDNVSFFCASVNEKELADKYKDRFDIVLLIGVLEHLEDEQECLAFAKTVLKDGGFFIVMVPANSRLWSSLDEWVGHYRRYTKNSLIHLLISMNFTPLAVRVFGFPFTLLFDRFHVSISRTKTYIPSGKSARLFMLVEPIIYRILLLDRFFDFTEMGTEILGLFQKQKG